MRHLPNLICLVRIALIWPIVAALNAGAMPLALALFVAAAVSDGLDGYLAKRFSWTSELGKFLDPMADKLLLITVFVASAWLGLVPWWLAAAVVARDVMIGLGAFKSRRTMREPVTVISSLMVPCCSWAWAARMPPVPKTAEILDASKLRFVPSARSSRLDIVPPEMEFE